MGLDDGHGMIFTSKRYWGSTTCRAKNRIMRFRASISMNVQDVKAAQTRETFSPGGRLAKKLGRSVDD